ncbi:hypothetical protein PDESU_05828 [Pontiella desulfatans]|uniref:Uncharacterized protein n=1 Tax=Pontiella desulfatans TaxID=2750659 RepID=A0A6C2UAS3_PONDE|nr:hypothetical protein [Pontiella desulfatans]VGO17232.1 hypothetical protein PDESU_05828 [Pontiella desulfatans]
MKRPHLFILLAAIAASVAAANDFFGIPILAEPKDDINAIIQNLIKGESEKASLHLRHLGKTAPQLAKKIKLSGLTIPCADCSAEKKPECEACNGKAQRLDPHSLRYLQYKFDTAIEGHLPVEKAWAGSIAAFNLRKKQVPERGIFQGRIIEIGQVAFVIKGEDGEIFNLMGCVTNGARVGQPYMGYYWPMPQCPHTYQGRKIKSYTLNLWWDY